MSKIFVAHLHLLIKESTVNPKSYVQLWYGSLNLTILIHVVPHGLMNNIWCDTLQVSGNIKELQELHEFCKI